MSWPAPTGEPVGPSAGPADPRSLPTIPPDRTAAATVDSAGVPTLPGPAERAAGAEVATAPPDAEIGTLAAPPSRPPTLAPLNPRTGLPARPWTIWTSAVLLFTAAATVTVGLLLAMWAMASPWQQVSPDGWAKDDRFNAATWLTAQFPSEPASPLRVVFAIVCCALAVLVAGATSVIGYYAFAGYRWTRIGALVALAVSLSSLLLTPIASACIALVALGAVPLWLPPSTRFFARWQLLRHPAATYSEPVRNVSYGPLPRYR